MPDYRSMYDSEYLGHWDLQGREVTVTIATVIGASLTAPGGRKSKKPVVMFEGKEKGLCLNKTNGKTIAAGYGNDTAEWAGKKLVLYPSQTSFGSEMVDCIRVKLPVPA